MKVLITGGAGFIGSHVAEQALNSGHEVIIADNLVTGSREHIPANARFYKVDIGSPYLEILFKVEKPDAVIHMAAQADVSKSIQQPVEDARVNLLHTIQLLCCCRDYQVKKIVYSSSCAVYGDPHTEKKSITEEASAAPINFYGASKHAPELYFAIFHRLYGLPYTILRYANVYGPRQSYKGEGGVVAAFINKLLQGESPSIYGDGEQTRDFIFVSDVASANIKALESDKGNNMVLNIGGHTRTSINTLYQTIASILSVQIPPVYYPVRPGDIRDSCLNNGRAMFSLNWKPEYDLRQGLLETIAFYRNRLGSK